MSSDDLNDDDVFLSPSADVPVGELMGGTHVVNGSRPSSGYYSRQTSGYTASQDTPPTSAVLRVEDEGTDRQRTPSPTGYRGAMPPPAQLPTPEEDDIIHKTILLGDSGVGKTSLLVQFDTGKFQPGTFSATVGIGFTNKVVTVDGSKVKLQIWDTAGQERFRSVTHAYYRDAHALLLLYDVMSKTSFDNTRAWLAEVHEYAQDDVVIMLIGNKCDVNGERVVRREDGERLAREYNVAFMETSAKTGLNVDLAFMAVARELKARKSNNPNERKFNVADYVRQEAKSDGCVCNVG
ncbi:ras-related protein Rab-37-like [Penaeus japonicus]|uniref:ras-related protein Rab-37-like n=1 Tax=Penaeus japonicus TaxID=27405 RepID=UPI001C715748|nr:ras-related protein Rab-37-like [Penaeus japonicus]